ncbi:hypothetical protein HZS61_007896 [Fusarium oxysporum f. sp. conglutinans]|uniref:Uncharacterized protein n=1 Tax=Fusarium oxysporum f. sp. conglutinans TaxID=100902 RepID=A0A8H6GZJ2_FUSOX|nr:hypothetical protein HZS61_007896 [Fusarium oxysporum f. sp. conglutinans]
MTAITGAASLTLLCLSATDCHRIEVLVSFHFIVNQASGWFTILTELALPLIFVSATLVAHPVHRRCPEVNHLPLTLANSQSKEPSYATLTCHHNV